MANAPASGRPPSPEEWAERGRAGASGPPAEGRDADGDPGTGRGERSGELPASPFSAGEVGAGILIALGVILVSGFAIAAVDLATGGLQDEDLSTAASLTSQLFVVLAFIGVPVMYATSRKGLDLTGALRSLGLLRIGLAAIGIGAMGWLIYFLLSIPLSLVITPEQEDVTRNLGIDTDVPLQLIVAALLIIPGASISEEVFFRGFIYGGLRSSMAVWPAALGSGVLFGSLHLVSGNWAVAVVLSLLGVVLALLYERTGSLWTPIATHAINNTLAFLVLIDVINVG